MSAYRPLKKESYVLIENSGLRSQIRDDCLSVGSRPMPFGTGYESDTVRHPLPHPTDLQVMPSHLSQNPVVVSFEERENGYISAMRRRGEGLDNVFVVTGEEDSLRPVPTLATRLVAFLTLGIKTNYATSTYAHEVARGVPEDQVVRSHDFQDALGMYLSGLEHDEIKPSSLDRDSEARSSLEKAIDFVLPWTAGRISVRGVLSRRLNYNLGLPK